MCGISGFFKKSGHGLLRPAVLKMMRTQTHRGPDANGIFMDHVAALAHNRLSFLDLSEAGNQPFEDDEISLVYNGEIYNFLELRKEFPNFEFKSSSDTEVLFVCLKYWGIEKTLGRIRGMFAFALYNKLDHSLIIARDRLGIKPLFYGVDATGIFYFASEQKAILSVANFELDPVQMLFSSLGINEKSRFKTSWKNLYTLEPGCFAVVEKGGIEVQKYFRVSELISEERYLGLNRARSREVVEEFEHLFDTAVKGLLVSDVPLGAFVSGGIDSSLIASYAARYQSDLKLFTANVVGKFSEFEDAKILAKTIGKDLYEYPYKKEMLLEDWAPVTLHYESPITTHFNALPFSRVSALANEHGVKAVLTGEGADEMFLGYPRLLSKKFDSLIKLPFSILNCVYSKIPRLGNYVNRGEGSEGLLSKFELCVQGYTRQILNEEDSKCFEFLPEKKRLLQGLTTQSLQEGIVSLLWRNDRMGMMHSLEARFPFLDEKVLEFAINLPVKYKIGRSRRMHNIKHPFLIDKMIVRKLGENKLPQRLVRKKKNGFPTFGLRHMEIKSEFLEGGVLAEILGLTRKKVDFMVNNSSSYHNSLLASFEVWAKLFVQGQTTENVGKLVNTHIKMIN